MKTYYEKYTDAGILARAVHPKDGTNTIHYSENGDKNKVSMPTGWNSPHKDIPNNNPECLILVTGKTQNTSICVIDADNQQTVDRFDTLLPNHEFKTTSVGKAGAHYYFLDDGRFNSFRKHGSILDLDFQATGKNGKNAGIYAVSEGNLTKKKCWQGDNLPTLVKMPTIVSEELSAYITPPTTIRNACEYLSKGYLPTKKILQIVSSDAMKDIEPHTLDGSSNKGRNNYILSNGGYLVRNGIDVNIIVKVLAQFNSFFAQPLAREELRTVGMQALQYISQKTAPAVERVERSIISYYDSYGHKWEIFKDLETRECCFYNYKQGKLHTRMLSRHTAALNYNEETTDPQDMAQPLDEKDISKGMRQFYIKSNPTLDTGANNDIFNTFVPSQALKIIQNPLLHKDSYKRPQATIDFFENTLVNTESREYFLSFFQNKFKTFTKSNVIFNLAGGQGSGKGILIRLLSQILPVKKPTYGSFKSDFNEWLDGQYLINLNEYGKRLRTKDDKNEFYEKLKEYSEQGSISINAKGRKEFDIDNFVTFILTANTDPLLIEKDDRRVAYIELSDINIEEAQWCKKYGGVEKLVETMINEINDFSYWLATEIKPISKKDYQKSPMTALKVEKISDSLPEQVKLAKLIKASDFKAIIDIAIDRGILKTVTKEWLYGNMDAKPIQRLLSKNCSVNGFTRAMKAEGYKKIQMRDDNSEHFRGYKNIVGLADFIADNPDYAYETEFRVPLTADLKVI